MVEKLEQKETVVEAVMTRSHTPSIYGHQSIYSLLADWRVSIAAGDWKKWHLVHPARGYLQGIGDVVVLATDGLLALFWDGGDTLIDGHIQWFIGPVSRHYIDELDWDFVNNKRKVNVFRRKDGSMCILPTDWVMDDYWKTRAKYGFGPKGPIEQKKPRSETNKKPTMARLMALALEGLG